MLRPLIDDRSPLIVKLARLFSVLHPAIANVTQQIINVAQQFGKTGTAV